MNVAQQLLHSLGVPVGGSAKVAHGNKEASASKRGPGRFHRGGKAGNRIARPRKTRAADALSAAWAQKRITKAPLRDEHGAYTLVGPEYEVEGANPTAGEHVIRAWKGPDEMGYTARRKWLGGISAQRGY